MTPLSGILAVRRPAPGTRGRKGAGRAKPGSAGGHREHGRRLSLFYLLPSAASVRQILHNGERIFINVAHHVGGVLLYGLLQKMVCFFEVAQSYVAKSH